MDCVNFGFIVVDDDMTGKFNIQIRKLLEILNENFRLISKMVREKICNLNNEFEYNERKRNK